MIVMTKEAFAARHPQGSHIHTNHTHWRPSENPKAWPTPNEASPSQSSSSLTSSRTSTSTDLERLSKSESTIAVLQNILHTITSRLDNQELKNAATDKSISAIDCNVLQLKTALTKHSADASAIASGYSKMQASMDAIIQILQATQSTPQAQSGQQDDGSKC